MSRYIKKQELCKVILFFLKPQWTQGLQKPKDFYLHPKNGTLLVLRAAIQPSEGHIVNAAIGFAIGVYKWWTRQWKRQSQTYTRCLYFFITILLFTCTQFHLNSCKITCDFFPFHFVRHHSELWASPNRQRHPTQSPAGLWHGDITKPSHSRPWWLET